MSVYNLNTGESGEITDVFVGGAAGERLAALGVCRGARITCLGFSFFKGSVLVAVGGNRIAVRKSLALKIEVARCDGKGEICQSL